jgi:hypothetical protein
MALFCQFPEGIIEGCTLQARKETIRVNAGNLRLFENISKRLNTSAVRIQESVIKVE